MVQMEMEMSRWMMRMMSLGMQGRRGGEGMKRMRYVFFFSPFLLEFLG